MIGGDEGDAVFGEGRFDDAFELGVDFFERDEERFLVAGVSDHVGIGEIDEDKVGAFFDTLDRFVRNFFGTHLWRLIMGRDVLAALDEDVFFVLVGQLAAAVEEVGGVGVFLRFGDVSL